MADEADEPIIVPPPGQILRRAARTKIRKPSLLGDGGGHRFAATRRVQARAATTSLLEPRSSSDRSSSDHDESVESVSAPTEHVATSTPRPNHHRYRFMPLYQDLRRNSLPKSPQSLVHKGRKRTKRAGYSVNGVAIKRQRRLRRIRHLRKRQASSDLFLDQRRSRNRNLLEVLLPAKLHKPCWVPQNLLKTTCHLLLLVFHRAHPPITIQDILYM